MAKGVIVGVISVLVIIGLVGGGFYIATHSKEDGKVAGANSDGGSIPLDTGGSTDTNVQPQKLAGTKLENYDPSGPIEDLKYIDLEKGSGATVEAGATIEAHYTGALAADGTIFQSSYDFGKPIEFSLEGVIPGWSQGVPGMKVGGKRRLFIPAKLAYGENPPADSGIPANADLVFDITLVSIK